MISHRHKLTLSVAIAAVAVTFFLRVTSGNTTHYRMVDDLMIGGELAQWEGKRLSVHGWVMAGSIRQEVVNQETSRTFVLQRGAKRIRVFSAGPVPDTFKDQSEVIAIGELVPAVSVSERAKSLGVTLEANLSHVVVAQEIQAKCPSRYVGATANKELTAR